MADVVEFDPDEWEQRDESLRSIVPVGGGVHGECACGDDQPRNVFVCRADVPGEYACGRYCCACFGGADDNLCCDCWCRKERDDNA